MALQSQAPRSQGIRGASSGGGGLRPMWPAVAGIAGLVAVVAVVVYFWTRGGDTPTDTNTPALAATDTSTNHPAVTPQLAPVNTTPPAPTAITTTPPNPTPNVPIAASTNNSPVGTPLNGSPAAGTGTVLKDDIRTAPATANGAPVNTPALPASFLPNDLRDKVDAAGKAMAAGGPDKLLEARTLLNTVLVDDRTPVSERRAVRGQMQSINDMLLFSPTIAQNDPMVDSYIVEEGDNITTITRKLSLPVDNRFLLRINGVSDPRRLRIGQKLKTVRAPFHVVVHKNEYRMDLYMGPPPSAGGRTTADGADETWTYIRSFPVGLGESNGTPEGGFVVRPKSKLVNPRWVNPRTNEVFEADNPKNPIGEYWIGLDGADANTSKFVGYGIHGTTEPDSIGQSRSMGCVRMLSEDVALVYEVLMDRVSTVRIVK